MVYPADALVVNGGSLVGLLIIILIVILIVYLVKRV